MKKCLSLFLTLVLLLSALAPTAFAEEGAEVSTVPAEIAAENLATIDVFRGTGSGFALDRAPTRVEAAAMLVRLCGAEEAAKAQLTEGAIENPFKDVADWAAADTAWLYANGLARGVGADKFGAERVCRAKDYAVFLLRALGYRDGEDFTYDEAEAFAAECGFYHASLFSGTFTRGDLAVMTWLALFAKVKDGGQTLLQALMKDGAVDQGAAQKLLNQYQSTGASLCAEGVRVAAGKWQNAQNALVITVQLASNSPTLAGEMLTLDKEALGALAETEDGTVLFRETALRTLADGWKADYGVKSGPYLFESYVKGWTEIGFLPCDYQLDAAAAVKALMAQLLFLRSGEIGAPLICSRAGKPFSLGDTYVEVDFDNQQLTYFKNGRMVLNSNVVTGKLDGHQTPTGLYYSHNKQRNCVLVGSDFRVFVKYWISIIHDVIGFHDASWRSVFGGEYYVDDGSHGCINTPDGAMEYLFNNLDDGTPVLMYGQNKWYDVNDPAASPVTQNPVHGQTVK